MRKLSDFFGFEPKVDDVYIVLVVHECKSTLDWLCLTHIKCSVKNEYTIRTSKGDLMLTGMYWSKNMRVYSTYEDFNKAVVGLISSYDLDNISLRRFPYTKGYLKKLIRKYPEEYL